MTATATAREAEKLHRDFQRATDKVHSSASKSGQATQQSVEQQYSQTYQALVRAGLKPQLREKYR